MSVTLFGIVIEARAWHQLKASFPIVVTLLPMVTEAREEHKEKA